VLNSFLEKHKLKKYFNEVLGRLRFGSKKNQLKYLINERGIPPSQIILIDDNPRHIVMARKLGVNTYLLKRGNITLKELIRKIVNNIDNNDVDNERHNQ